ncbi:MAG: NAD(P)/FAD-dependent oxidoreductase [Thermomicrobiales bacterium]
MSEHPPKTHVIIVGIGFAGLETARTLANQPGILVTVIDRTNHHLFQPLLYQVAIAGLEAPEIAEPARALLRKFPNIRFLMGTVRSVDLDQRIVSVDGRRLRYDYLVVATGSTTAHFNIPGIDEHAFEMKTLAQALTIRDQILSACEEATREHDPERRNALLTFVIVGGGATGVELAGSLAELKLHVLPRDYPEIRADEFRVLMVESTDYPLASMGEKLGRYTLRTLEDHFKVEIINGARVTEVRSDGVVTDQGEHIPAYTVIWTAGIVGARFPGLPEPARGGRIPTDQTLALADYPNVFVIGDLNSTMDPETDEPYPQLAQTAVQQGERTGKNILRAVRGKPLKPFHYADKGVYVTMGRNKGVAQVARLEFTGFPAWFAWLGIHLILLAGFRNRILVLTSWIYSYFTYDFAVRVIHRRRRFPK